MPQLDEASSARSFIAVCAYLAHLTGGEFSVSPDTYAAAMNAMDGATVEVDPPSQDSPRWTFRVLTAGQVG